MHYKSIKTQKVQYDDDDNHPVHSNEIGDRGVVAFSQGGSVLSGSFPFISL